MKQPHVEKILNHFGVTPVRDAFATPQNTRFAKWWGEGSPEGEDAFKQDWGQGLLWMNPPFNVFLQVLDKIRGEGTHVILVVPVWRRRKFTRQALEMALDQYVFPKGTLLFERKGKAMKGTAWEVRALLICGHHPRCELGDMGTHREGGDRMTQLPKPSWKEVRLTEEEPPPLYSINSLFYPFQATPEC